MNYLPFPPRAWSRVQDNINCIDPLVPPLGKYTVYVPLTKQTVSPGVADYQDKVLYKGNILQYRNNSSNLSKNQKYAQIVKGMWTNRTKSYATQSDVYSNPNTNSLLRQNYTISQNTNGASNPFNCNNKVILEGGTLACNTLANPCTNQLIKTYKTQNCQLITASDVPGFGVPTISNTLCWNQRVSTYIPRRRYKMTNSGDKWPQNYKAFVSSSFPVAPTVSINSSTSTTVTLSWTYKNSSCIPVSNFNIYQNNALIKSVSFKETLFTVDNLTPNLYSFYVKSVSNTIASPPSNTVTTTII
jgi:hypothetical protein